MGNNIKYLKLITSEYYTKPKFYSFVETFLNETDSCEDIMYSFNNLFNLENASGDQLDKIGTAVGIGRSLPTQNADIPSILPDSLFRMVIKAKIAKNHWDGTRKGMERCMELIFPDAPYEIVDNQDMSIKVAIIFPTITAAETAIITEGFIIPKPIGVRINYDITTDPFFGWDADTEFIKGWDLGRWSR